MVSRSVGRHWDSFASKLSSVRLPIAQGWVKEERCTGKGPSAHTPRLHSSRGPCGNNTVSPGADDTRKQRPWTVFVFCTGVQVFWRAPQWPKRSVLTTLQEACDRAHSAMEPAPNILSTPRRGSVVAWYVVPNGFLRHHDPHFTNPSPGRLLFPSPTNRPTFPGESMMSSCSRWWRRATTSSKRPSRGCVLNLGASTLCAGALVLSLSLFPLLLSGHHPGCCCCLYCCTHPPPH